MSEKVIRDIEERKEFLQIRQHYIDSAHRSSTVFDSTMITLTTGALGGSMLLLKNQDQTLIHKERLAIARSLLGLTLLLILISFILSENAHWLTVDLHDEEHYYKSSDKITLLKCKIECINKGIDILKRIPIFSLIIGVSFLVLFIYNNI